jgi:hypothetical protein
LEWLLLAFFILLFSGLLFPPMGPGLRVAKESAAMQTSRTIGLVMFQYSIDHDGHWPGGASSTEIFQKLIDGQYVTDPAIFFLPIPGKIKPTSLNLKPENVSWDVTVPLDRNSPDELPVVFSTGYRIEYKPGGQAIPIIGKDRYTQQGIAVCYHGNSAWFKKNLTPDGPVPNFIPADANLGPGPYRQLTPDGPLAP